MTADKPKRRSALSLPNYFLGAYNAYLLLIGDTGKRELTTTTKLALQQFFYRLRGTTGFSVAQVKAMIHFSYAHNPLHLADPRQYGTAQILYKVAPLFRRWCKEQATLIAARGLHVAITETIEEWTETDELFTNMMEELDGP